MKHKTVADVYTDYYLNQAGSGFGNVYASGVYQKGHGIGSFLGGLFRCVFPLLKSGSSAIGSEILKSGANIISDIGKSESPEVAFKKRGKEAINNLGNLMGEKMFGNGYKPAGSLKRAQSTSGSRGGKKAKKTATKKTAKKAGKKAAKKSTKKTTKKKPQTKGVKSKSKKPKSKGKSQLLFDIFA